MFHSEDDIEDESIWFYCSFCDEEYLLPENTVHCPVCDTNSIEAID